MNFISVGIARHELEQVKEATRDCKISPSQAQARQDAVKRSFDYAVISRIWFDLHSCSYRTWVLCSRRKTQKRFSTISSGKNKEEALEQNSHQKQRIPTRLRSACPVGLRFRLRSLAATEMISSRAVQVCCASARKQSCRDPFFALVSQSRPSCFQNMRMSLKCARCLEL